MYNNYGVNENHGDNSSQYHGDTPSKDIKYFERYLQNNSVIKEGTILESYMGGYLAHVSYGNGSGYAIWLSGLLGGTSGTSCINIPSSGSKVLLYAPPFGPMYILGCIPSSGSSSFNLYETEGSTIDFYNQSQHNYINDSPLKRPIENFSNGRPLDVFPGDWGIINELGNLISLLKGVVLLKATDLSQIQLNYIDDLVRIVSKTYEHISSIGDDIIYDDHGKVSREIKMSTTRSETLGYSADTDVLLKMASPEKIYKKPTSIVSPIDRLRTHFGFIGDLLHSYVTNNLGIGLFDLHLKKNGSLDVKTTKEISLRKILKVKTPRRVVNYSDSLDETLTPKEPFVYDNNNSLEPQDNDKLLWEEGNYNYQKYGSQWSTTDSIPIDEGTTTSQIKGTAEIKIREDGSVIIRDNAGSFIELDGKGNINISSKGDIHLRNGGNIVLMSGKDTSIRAKENIDICCTNGDIRAKAENALQMYSNTKGILLETNSSLVPDSGKNENQNYSGITLRSKQSHISLISGQNNNFWASKNNILLGYEENRLLAKKINLGSNELNISNIVGSNDEMEIDPTLGNITNIVSQAFQVISQDYKVSSTNWTVSSQIASLSGLGTTTIYGGGPSGTLVNHIHSEMMGDIFELMQDGGTDGGSADPGQRVKSITKIGVPIPVVPTYPTVTPKTTLMTPYNKSLIDLVNFSFRNILYTNNLYEFSWQRTNGSPWSFTKDIYQNSMPFPGYNFAKYTTYIPTLGSSNKPGTFTKGMLEGNYKI